MKKAAVLKEVSRLPGFRKIGNFYIGTCNDDILSGYCVDAPPTNVYIWKFVLPAYDGVEFLHLSLGKRILDIKPSKNENDNKASIELSQFLLNDWVELSLVKKRKDLNSYIAANNLDSGYALWVQYLTYIRDREFDRAEQLEHILSTDKRFPGSTMVADNFCSLSQVKRDHGWEGCFSLLNTWLHRTKTAYCDTKLRWFPS
jgi:hypothetical protein